MADSENNNRVYIERIECSGCGPVENLAIDAAPLTLIYGANEAGKTSIVENLTRVLFKLPRIEKKKNRESTEGVMKIHVQLPGGKTRVFRGGSRAQSLDEILAERGKNFPPELYRLLYVRSSETALGESAGGVESNDLQGILSQQRLARQVRAKLPGETGYTFMEKGRLMTQKKIGAWKNVEEMKTCLDEMAAAGEAFAGVASKREMGFLEERLAFLNDGREKMEKARRHQAWKLNEEVRAILADPLLQHKKDLSRLEELVSEINLRKNEAARHRQRRGGPVHGEDDLQWLRAAGAIYGRGENRFFRKGRFMLMFLAGAGAVSLPVIYSFFPSMLMPFIALFSLVVLLLVLLLAFGLQERGISHHEMDELKEEFQRRFGEPPGSVASFEAWQRRVEKEIAETEALEKIEDEMARSIEMLEEKIALQLRVFAAGGRDPEETATALRERLLDMEKNYLTIKERLKSLQVPEEEYDPEPVDVEYSLRAYRNLENEIEEVREKIKTGSNQVQQLRQRLADFIGSEAAFSSDTAAVMESLKREEMTLRERIRDAMAGMIGGLAVKMALEKIESREKELLEEALNEKALQKLLERVTGHYNRFMIRDDEICVSDGTAEYLLEDLSSGAREQVLMVIRAGMALKGAGSDGLFMIFDDAFQFSDWKRRRYLVDMTVSMVCEGWQVFYFTMDDDIRERFVKAASEQGEGFFSLIELS